MKTTSIKTFCGVADVIGAPDHLRDAVEALASDLHEMWRAEFEAANGVGAVRMKDDGEGGEVNINAPYSGLPAKWQAENRAAADHAIGVAWHVVLQLQEARHHGVSRTDDDLVEIVADLVHQAWLARNGEWAPADQKVDYVDLSEELQEKDRVIARPALAVVWTHLAAEAERVSSAR